MKEVPYLVSFSLHAGAASCELSRKNVIFSNFRKILTGRFSRILARVIIPAFYYFAIAVMHIGKSVTCIASRYRTRLGCSALKPLSCFNIMLCLYDADGT